MKELEIEFDGKGEMTGTRIKQLLKSDYAFLYEVTDMETCQKRFEVFQKRGSKSNVRYLGTKK